MALTKTRVSLGSALTATGNSDAVDTADSYESDVFVQIVQVGTATTASTWKLQASDDTSGSDWYDATGPISGPTAASTVTWAIPAPPPSARRLRVAFTGQSGGTSATLTGSIGKVTGI
jgi:hypothetical protein